MKGFILFIISIIGVSVVFLASTMFSIFYYIFHFWKVKEAYGKVDKYFYDMAHSVDQFGNVNCQNLFNHILISKKYRKEINTTTKYYENSSYHKFGNVDDTISYIIADNQVKSTLSNFGKFWARLLNFVDTTKEGTHLEKSIVAKIRQDKVARIRLETKWKEDEYKLLVAKSRNTVLEPTNH
jgi:hypothetical protein